jgi:hypothetical protein
MITLHSLLNVLFPTAATLFFIGVYSLLLSTIFGHPSYWRSLQKKYQEKEGIKTKSLKSPDGLYRYLIDPYRILIGGYSKKQANASITRWKNYSHSIIYKMSSLTKIPQKDLFSVLIDCMVIEVLSFLPAADLLSMSEVSHSMLSLTNREIVWINLSNGYFSQEKGEELHAKIPFFSFMKTYPYSVVKGRAGLNVIINGGVYDLTDFKAKHPGGEEILNEWNGNDASQIFSLALHSSFAHELMKEYMIWPKSSLISR